MSETSNGTAALIESCRGRDLDAYYLAYFKCFNRSLYYEAHEVLENLWHPDRHGPNGAFYKGLIQLAGAFVHLQKSRPQPAAALFKLAQANLKGYPATHEHLNVGEVLRLVETWLARLASGEAVSGLLTPVNAPKVQLMERR